MATTYVIRWLTGETKTLTGDDRVYLGAIGDAMDEAEIRMCDPAAQFWRGDEDDLTDVGSQLMAWHPARGEWGMFVRAQVVSVCSAPAAPDRD